MIVLVVRRHYPKNDRKMFVRSFVNATQVIKKNSEVFISNPSAKLKTVINTVSDKLNPSTTTA